MHMPQRSETLIRKTFFVFCRFFIFVRVVNPQSGWRNLRIRIYQEESTWMSPDSIQDPGDRGRVRDSLASLSAQGRWDIQDQIVLICYFCSRSQLLQEECRLVRCIFQILRDSNGMGHTFHYPDKFRWSLRRPLLLLPPGTLLSPPTGSLTVPWCSCTTPYFVGMTKM